MHEQEELGLNYLKQKYSEIPLPDNLDAYIHIGIRKAKSERRASIGKLSILVAACLLPILLMGCIRVSSIFASWVSSIPGFEKIVALIEQDHDQGLKLAMRHDFMQPVGLSNEHDGIRLTVDSIIVDDVRMNIFYTVENHSKLARIDQPSNLKILDSDGKDLQASYSFNYLMTEEEKKSPITQQRVDIQLSKGIIMPDNVQLRIDYDGFSTPWKVAIPVDHARFKDMQQSYELNQSVEVEGQKITFTKATVYPTRIVVEASFDEANSKQIFGFRDISIVNEKGENLTNNMSTLIDTNHRILYFESNYFDMPNHLYIEGSTLTALDKDKLDLVIDPVKHRIMKAPDDRVKLDTGLNFNTLYQFKFLLDLEEWDHMFYRLFAPEFKDDSGKTYLVSDSNYRISRVSNGPIEIPFSIPNENYSGLLHFHIEDYPAPIRNQFRVTLK
jgi:hypothetical protein